jgi:hypothetical protein
MFDEVIRDLETARDAISDNDGDKALTALTAVLLQTIDLFGHDDAFFAKFFPVLEQLKQYIQSGSYDDALALTLAMLVRFRRAQASISGVGDEKNRRP